MRQVDPAQLQPGGGADVATLTGQSFFPHLIADAFHHGLVVAFSASIGLLLIAIVASAMRGSLRARRRGEHSDQTGLQATVRELAAMGTRTLPPRTSPLFQQAMDEQPSSTR